jgi:hypothetical protein
MSSKKVRLFREPDSFSGARVMQFIRLFRQSPGVGATHERRKRQELSLLRMPKLFPLTLPPGAANEQVHCSALEGKVADQLQAAISRAAATVTSERTSLVHEQLTTGDSTFAFVQRYALVKQMHSRRIEGVL